MEFVLLLFFVVIPGLAIWFFRLWQKAKRELDAIQSSRVDLDIELDLREARILEDSPTLQAQIDKVIAQQKALVGAGKAGVCKINWTVGNSRAAGERMARNQIKLMLLAFDGESDAIIERVTWKNLGPSSEKITKLADQLNKLGQIQACHITPEYVKLKLNELKLVHQHREAINREREEQRAIREQMREEEKALRELERAQIEADREAERFAKALEKATREAEKAQGAKQVALVEEIQRLQQALANALETKQRALSQAQQTKSGYVYIISNIGSFGEGVYKIGMTRRLDPIDRVDELGDASVPFPFDVHAMIYTTDAPGLENALHREFRDARVNLENYKKEFFRVDLEKIEASVRKHHAGEFRMTLAAKAEQFRKSESQRLIISRGAAQPLEIQI